MAASSVASKRSFSTFGFIHTKLRNRLGPEKVKKLVYIKTNMIQISGMDLFDYDSDCSSIDSMDVSRLEDVTA
jgi:hypothetical protein